MNTRVNAELVSLLKEKDEIFDVTSTLDYPTIAEVVMWLYEKHGIWIVVFPELFNGEIVKFYPSIFEQGVGEDIEQYYNSPTEAYEAAIKYCLKKII